MANNIGDLEIMDVVLASNNPHKINELQYLLAPYKFNVLSQTQLKIPEVAETGLTFVENAILKARNACKYANLPAIADDSGLEVDALNGEPGIYSARYAGDKATHQDNIEKLLANLKDVPEEKRTARFQCLIVFLKFATDPTPIICQGTWRGRILFNPRGSNGFGYDPIFFDLTHNCSAAELPPEIKNRISHRAQALQQLALLNNL